MAATIYDVRRIALSWPDTVEKLCFGTPAFYLRKKFMLCLREDGETLVVKVRLEERSTLLETEPDVFSLTSHYVKYPLVLVSLPNVRIARLAESIEGAWRLLASKKQLAALPSLERF